MAIVGEPLGLDEALAASDRAYLFAAGCTVLCGVVSLALRPGLTQPLPAEERREPLVV